MKKSNPYFNVRLIQFSNRFFMRKINQLFLIAAFLLLSAGFSSAQTHTWVGSVSNEFFNADNWNPSNWTPDVPNAADVLIGKGNPYNPTFIQGGGRTEQRYGHVNTTGEANFTINGALYSWNNDSINGYVNIKQYAELNIRNIGYIGRSDSGNVVVSGSLTTKYDLYVGTGTSGKGNLTIDDGAVYIGRTLYIGNNGATGHIKITGLGGLHCTGNVTSKFQSWVDDGTIDTDSGDSLKVAYNSANDETSVTVVRNLTGMVKEYDTYVVLDNGIIKATINKGNAKVTSLKVNGVETVSQSGRHVTIYYDWHAENTLEGPSHCVFSVVHQNDSLADVSFKHVYTPSVGDHFAVDMDIHFVIKKNMEGLYTYSELEHKAEYPELPVSGWRMIYSLANDGHQYTCERIYVDSLRHWEMPSLDDYAAASPTPIKEIVKLNTGVRAGHYDGKYEYVSDIWNLGTYGLASDVNKIGTWIVFGSHEFFNCGPIYHDLNAAAGIIHVCMNGVHYNAKGFNVAQGDHWRKLYGPYLLYFNNKDTGDEAWADAKKQAKIEDTKWPYKWLKNNVEYPLADARGSISGRLAIGDIFKPNISWKNAWIGVTKISNADNQWQFETRNYQYWVRTGPYGEFTIPNVRPGTYTLFAYADGEVGEFKKINVTVTAGQDNNLGNLIWTIKRNKGKLLWEVGVPNRSSEEFAHGHTDFFEGFVYNNFANEFSNPIEYNVADKNWATALPYAHCPLLQSTGAMDAWRWNLNFNITDSIPNTGDATLTLAFASSDHAQLRVYVNDQSSYLTYFYPDNAGGNALLRQSNHAMYATKEVKIPMSKLHRGKNTISLVMPSTQSMVNHVMYDYMSLEAPVYDCNGDLNGSAYIDSCGTCASGNTGITPVLDASLCQATVIPEAPSALDVNIYPNPTTDYFTVEVAKEIHYKVYDLTGQLVEHGDIKGHGNIGQQLARGTYILSLEHDGHFTQTKLVKN